MSLDYDLTKVPLEKRSVMEDGKAMMSLRTQAIIFGTMYVGMSEITEDNAEEFFRRIRFYETVFGPVRIFPANAEKKIMLTAQDIRDHIGLSTNASNLTEAKFKKITMENLERELTIAWDNEAHTTRDGEEDQ